MSSFGQSKASRGGKEDLKGDRTSGAVQGSISKDSNYSILSNVLTEESKTPILESGIRLGSINEREIVDWINYWDEVVAEHPTYPFVFANSMSAYVKYKLIVENDIQQGYTELNRASLSQLAKWLSACVRPVDNISFIEALDKNVFFPGKRNIVLTEKNYREFYENLKEFSRDFALLLGMLKYSLYEDQEHPPMNTRDGEGILSVYLKKIPCDYGYAVWSGMPGQKKYKKFSEFLKDFMTVCQKHREICESAHKPLHAANSRKNNNGNETNISKMSPSEHHKRFYDNKEKSPVIPSTPKSSSVYQKHVTVVEERPYPSID